MTYLRQFYLEYNQRYFNGRLPKDIRIQWIDLTKHKALGRLTLDTWDKYSAESGKFEFYKTSPAIEISAKLKSMKRIAVFTLLHEMAHLSVDLKNPKSRHEPHGHHWQREMKRLAGLGAFNGLW